MIGPIQSISLALVTIALLVVILNLGDRYLKQRHELKKKELDHKQKIVEDFDDQ